MDVYVKFVPGPSFFLAELHCYVVRVLALDLEGYVVRRYLAVGQDLIDQQPGGRCHQGSSLEGDLPAPGVAGEHYLVARDHLVVEVGRLPGRVDPELDLLSYLRNVFVCLLHVDEVARRRIGGLEHHGR